MFKQLMAGVDKTLVKNLVILHTLVIAVSNYLVTIRFDLLTTRLYFQKILSLVKYIPRYNFYFSILESRLNYKCAHFFLKILQDFLQRLRFLLHLC